MLKVKLKDLLAIYKKLPYIIFKQKYLIPPPPIYLRYCNVIYDKYEILNLYNKWLPDMVDQKFIERAQKKEQRQALINEYFQEINKRRNNTKNQLKKYYESYIFPLQRHHLNNAAIIYYTENKNIYQKYWKKTNKKYNLADIYTLFNEQPVNVKKIYEQKALAKHNIILQNAQLTSKKYKIPQITKTLPQFLYGSIKYGRVSSQHLKEYINLSESEKKVYIDRARIANKQKYTAFMDFLKSKDLTFQQFKLIKRTCQQIETKKKQLKLKKNNKQQPNIQQKIQQQQKEAFSILSKKVQPFESEVQLNQTKEEKSQTIAQPELQKRQQQTFKEQEQIQKQLQQQLKLDQKLEKKMDQIDWDQNFDLMNQQIDIYDLKKASSNKISKNKKKNKL